MNNSQIRAKSRAMLGGSIFANNWVMLVLVCLIIEVVLGILSATGIGFLLIGPVSVGLAFPFLAAIRGKEKVDLGDLLKGVTDNQVVQNFLTGLMVTIFTALWALLLIIPGIVKYYAYSQAYYLRIDHPEYDWKTAIDESQKLMNGKKWSLFCLDFSFIGWYILGFLACGIGVLFVMPYHYAARACFYDELVGGKPTAEEAQ